MLRTTLARLKSPFQEFGTRDGLVYVVDRLLRRLSRERVRLQVYDLVAQPVSDRPLLPARMLQAYACTVVGPDDALNARMLPPAHVLAARRAQGAVCLALQKNEDFVGYAWVCPGTYVEDEVRCSYHLPAGGACSFDFDVYVFPKYRQGLAFAVLWQKVNEFLYARGGHWSYSRITRFNLASRRAHARLGAVCVGQAAFLVVGPWELMWSGLPPRWHISLSPASSVHLNLPLPATPPG